MSEENKSTVSHRLVEFFAKLGIISVIAYVLGIVDAIAECVFVKDISFFIHFTTGYLSCLIFNWRWCICLEKKEKGKKQS